MERHFGYAVARTYAGHDGKNDAGTTPTYVRADVYEVARALAMLTSKPTHSRCQRPAIAGSAHRLLAPRSSAKSSGDAR
ncbi:hypothetical protein [Micromonospora pisi]|uniref:hypothetical protein n=1 Tax=Micromonospora pisi TaxID=589240 RepID=UPI001B87B68B|nr:hypothetical protein [Micromonospora pisi]